MHISKLQLLNYRNFARESVHFRQGVNTIIGENGSGKTNLFRAMRLLLDDDLLRMSRRLDERDFNRHLGDWRGHWIVISLEFDDVSQDEAIQALFLHGTGNIQEGVVARATYNLIFRPKAAVRLRLAELKPGDVDGLAAVLKDVTIVDYETIFTGKSSADFTDRDTYKRLVGDFDAVQFPNELDPPELGGRVPGMMSISHEICFTFIQALRDVVAEFQNNRTNPLLTLLRSKSGDINVDDFAAISNLVKGLNGTIEKLPDVVGIRDDIRQTITDAAGETYSPARLSIRSDLSDDADRLFQSLKLFVGETGGQYEGAIHELSLGGANLIYLTLKLLEFKYQKGKQACANILVVEEPEAHIHTHIQKTLFDRLNYTDTQIIYSTHSTHISEVSNVENINILGRVGEYCEVYQPAKGLQTRQVDALQRYLDAVRSNLLFAKSVLLVEGDAEEILFPILVKRVLGISLDELGISLINIRSTGFRNVAVLFHQERVRKRCAIVTDLDAPTIDTTEDPGDTPEVERIKARARRAAAIGASRREQLRSETLENPWITCHFAAHTFEVDFVTAGNVEMMVALLPDIYQSQDTIDEASEDLASGEICRYGPRAIRCAEHVGKGWFAIVLGRFVTADTQIPHYLLDAMLAAHRPLSPSLVTSIVEYRLQHIPDGAGSPEARDQMRAALGEYNRGAIDLPGLRAVALATFPKDMLSAVLERL
ncbi:MAG: ATP-dependent nuclease [Inquilinus sp.]|uniref:ATP-dependent nuclease n=1 Tax=Inquilinus sp. TaxID=1932117 RepID=UPI003F3D5EE9